MTADAGTDPLDAEDAKLVTLARSARARNATAEGAAVRDDTGRTYVATTVSLPSLRLTALQAAIVMAVASGAATFEAAAVVGDSGDSGDSGSLADADSAVAADLAVPDPGAGLRVILAGADGAIRAVVVAGTAR
jgi:hypothetical protein